MKKASILALLFLFTLTSIHASLVNNSNQSTAYIRQPARNTSIDIDAVYYNPAGLVNLVDGFHLAYNNQTIFQEKKIVNDLRFLNDPTYIGEVRVPVYPNFYAVYKKNKLAVSFGFGPNGGGGSADYATGLPSFESQISMLPAMLSGMGLRTTNYSADIAFNGSSIFLGFQGNVSYALTQCLSVAAGVRYISAKNTYEGHIRNIMVNPLFAGNPSANMISASGFFTLIGQPALAAQVADKTVNAEQTGSALTPVLSVFFKPSASLSMSLRYEFNTSLSLKNKTTRDDTGMFPNGYTFRNDLPAILSFGIQYAFNSQWRAMFSANYFFDKNADWEGKENFVDRNSLELSLGTEYDLSQTITLSMGYLRKDLGLTDGYQTDLGFKLSSSTIGAGALIHIGSALNFELGGMYVFYSDYSKALSMNGIPAKETYSMNSFVLSVGLTYRF